MRKKTERTTVAPPQPLTYFYTSNVQIQKAIAQELVMHSSVEQAGNTARQSMDIEVIS